MRSPRSSRDSPVARSLSERERSHLNRVERLRDAREIEDQIEAIQIADLARAGAVGTGFQLHEVLADGDPRDVLVAEREGESFLGRRSCRSREAIPKKLQDSCRKHLHVRI